MRKGVLWWVITGLFVSLLLSGCYKNELEELEKINFSSKKNFAFPLFETDLSINDTIPYAIPLVSLSDTVKSDLAISSYLGSSFGNIDYVEFKVTLKHNFPVNGAVQFYFTDDNQNIIDSLFTEATTVAGASNGGNMSTILLNAYMDANKYNRIRNASNMLILYTLNTTSTTLVYPSHVQISCGIKFGATF